MVNPRIENNIIIYYNYNIYNYILYDIVAETSMDPMPCLVLDCQCFSKCTPVVRRMQCCMWLLGCVCVCAFGLTCLCVAMLGDFATT